MGPRLSVTPRGYAAVAHAALAVCILIVFTDAAVRLTASGLCRPNWPSARAAGSRRSSRRTR